MELRLSVLILLLISRELTLYRYTFPVPHTGVNTNNIIKSINSV
jgi:hypothetical protein